MFFCYHRPLRSTPRIEKESTLGAKFTYCHIYRHYIVHVLTIHRSWTKLQTVNLLRSGNISAIGICFVVSSLCPTVISNKDQTTLNFCTTSNRQNWTRTSRIKIRQLWTFVPQASFKFELTLLRACVHVVGTSCRTATLMVIKQRKHL